MLKYDSPSSRAAALADEDELSELFHSARETKPRARRSLETEPPRTRAAARVEAEDDDDGEVLVSSRRRVPVRKAFFPKTRIGRLLLGGGVLLALACAVAGVLVTRNFFETDPRFRVDSASAIQIVGNSQVTRQQLLAVFGDDIGRNIFFVPLAARQAELQELPWVEHATVMRLLPNQLRIAVTERTPVAFVRQGNHVGLVDANGLILRMPAAMMAAKHYSFPVVNGISAEGDAEVRATRMQIFARFVNELDATGSKVSAQVSEVDLSDPEDVRAVLPGGGSDILVHFGDSDFGNRYRSFEEHLAGWKQQYPRLAAVDLRFEHQTVLEMAKAADAAEQPGEGDMDANAVAGSRQHATKAATQAAAHGAKSKAAPHPSSHPTAHTPAAPARRHAPHTPSKPAKATARPASTRG